MTGRAGPVPEVLHLELPQEGRGSPVEDRVQGALEQRGAQRGARRVVAREEAPALCPFEVAHPEVQACETPRTVTAARSEVKRRSAHNE